MKQAHLDDLRQATTAEELLATLLAVGNDMGFGLGAMVFRQGRIGDGENPIIRSVHNTPDAWREQATNLTLAKSDPVFSRLQVSKEPFFYDQDFYLQTGCIELWEEGSPFGYANGVSASLHLPGDRTLFWGFDRSSSIPKNDRLRTSILAETQLVGVFAVTAAERILSPAQVALSDAQLAVLRHTRDGHSSWVIARLLEMTEDNVNYHLKRCRAKLGVATKHQAVHKAIELGLLA
ncbi:MAG: hypothetical protein E6R08_09070 [Nevskiaceae bacterium]|nr:MAG: hypothetical protein E6R08_09070 [Nevskiaceae bacterium]